MSFSFFVEMAWKSALIAGGALVLLTLLPSRAPADRAALLRLAVGLLLALPLISGLLPALQVELAASDAATPIDLAALAALQAQAGAASGAAEAPSFWDDPTMLIALLYAGGLIMVGGRLLAGLWTLRRWTRDAEPIVDLEWRQTFERVRDGAGASGRLKLLVSEEAPSPLSWGWRRPVILIDRDSHDRSDDADAILAHEIAHVVRGDWLTLMLARVTVVLFWFNPLVWMLERAMIQEAEEAADSYALNGVEPARYAQTLVNCMQHARSGLIPANSISSAGLSRRVRAVLEGRRTPTGSVLTLGAMAATVAFAAPLAALELTEKAREAAPEAPVAPALAALPTVKAHLPASVAAAIIPAPPAPAPAPAASLAVAPVPPAVAAIGAPPAPAPQAPLRFAFVAPQAGASDHYVDGAAIAEAVAEAQREAHEGAREAAIEAARAVRESRHEIRRAHAEAKRSMAAGAADMERGADEMERGAKEMRKEASKIRTSHAYREKLIAEEAARGETITHADLFKAADGLESGSKGMIEGAKGMRRGAAEMRRQRFD